MDKKQIVFVENGPADMSAKMAFVLRNKGYETILISLMGDIEGDFLKKAYNQRISFNLKFFKINLKNLPQILFFCLKNFFKIINILFKIRKIQPYMLITRSNPSWMCVLFKFFFPKSPFIYFPYDIRSFGYANLQETKMAGIPNFEIKSEKYCFENADGIIYKGDPQELDHLNENVLGKGVKIKCPKVYFFPYCLDELMIPIKKNKCLKEEINLVYTGYVIPSEEWFLIIKSLVDQKIHIHFYGKNPNLSKEEDHARITARFGGILNNKYFHLHEPVNQNVLSKEISKYDFGVFSFDPSGRNTNISTGNKFSSYIESGIAIIILKNFKVLAKLIDKYKIGINISLKEINQLRKIIEKTDYKSFIKNLPRARKELSMNNQIERLENFFNEAIKHKKDRTQV